MCLCYLHLCLIFLCLYLFLALCNKQQSFFSHFVGQIDLHGMEVDDALRYTLSFFRLPGEAQKIERIMQVRSQFIFLF